MSKIRIKNFGPIKDGLTDNDGWLEVKSVTVFIGNQGSGKSTAAKLISTMTWMEKALVRGDFGQNEVDSEIVKLHCSYQKIEKYFREDTIIEYHGKAYIIRYTNGEVTTSPNPANGYSFPKIMYVPAERNLVGSVRNVRKLKGLPSTLYTFADEFFDALEDLDGIMDLPINNAKVEFESLTQEVTIKGTDYSVELPIASSGFQSFVPLYLVTDYLAKSLGKKQDLSKNQLSIEEERRLMRQVQDLMSDPTLSHDIKRIRLRQLSEERNYAAFINIVEEPEQNLFPTSQRNALNAMLAYNTLNNDDKLIITTHSPYLINSLILAVKAHELYQKIDKNNLELVNKLTSVVELPSMVDINKLVIYEMNEENGTISKLETIDGLPSDKNYLNGRLGELNTFFDRLITIELSLR